MIPTIAAAEVPYLTADQMIEVDRAMIDDYGIDLDDDIIKEVMNLQENLHWALGRDRKHASIGVYDLDRVTLPELRYRAVGPEELSFVPLGYDPEADGSSITPKQILEEHPKGTEYAGLLADFQKYPLLADGEGGVLSMPPIINSEHTRVTDDTRNFSHAQLRRIQAEMLLDCVSQVTETKDKFKGLPLGARAVQIADQAV